MPMRSFGVLPLTKGELEGVSRVQQMDRGLNTHVTAPSALPQLECLPE